VSTSADTLEGVLTSLPITLNAIMCMQSDMAHDLSNKGYCMCKDRVGLKAEVVHFVTAA